MLNWLFNSQYRQNKLLAAFYRIVIGIVVNMIASSFTLHQADGLKYSQVLGNSGLAYSQKISQGIDTKGIGVTLTAEQVHQFEASGV